MVQILEGNSVLAGLLGGLSKGIPPAIEQYQQNKRQAQQMQQENEAAKRLGIDLSGIQDPNMRKTVVAEMLKQQGKDNRLNKTQDFLGKIFQGKQEVNPSTENSGQQNGFNPSNLSNEDIAQIAALDPNLGNLLQKQQDVSLRENREERKNKRDLEASYRKETAPMREKLAEKAMDAQQGIQNKQQLLSLIKNGDLNDPTYAALAESLPLNLGKRLLSEDTVQYKAGLVEEFGDLRNIFQGQTRVKELEILENKLADIYLTDSQKEAILNSRINALKADVIRAEAAEELENQPLGVLQYQKAVDKLAKPRLEALFNQVLDEQKSIIKDAENRKKMALDINDPEDKKIMQQIMKEAGGNKDKAKQIAKQKGYSVKGIK